MDTGYFAADERSAHGRLRPDVRIKNDWAFKAYIQFPVDVLNVSSHDLRYVAGSLANPGSARTIETEPIKTRLVSANTIDERNGQPVVNPFVVREVPSRQTGAKPLKVAFVGLTETSPEPPPGIKLIDPVEAAKRIVPQARRVADLVVVLAKITSKLQIERVARETTGIDVILNGNAASLEDVFTPPVLIGQTLIAFTPFETRMLGELRVYQNSEGRFSTKQRFITLDETLVPEDPAAKELVLTAAKSESDTRANSARSLETWLASNRRRIPLKPNVADSRPIESKPTFVTSAACSKCHVAQYVQWSNSNHAHATDSLVPRAVEFETSCLDCHATKINAAALPDGADTVSNVQCEQCHGPGGNHVANPRKGYGRAANMLNGCVSCHTAETSPDFNPQAAWAKIKH